jgi:hypothetical protein
MTEEKLNELEAVCRVAADEDGKVKLDLADVLDLVSELRNLRMHAAALSAHEGAIGNMHRLLTSLLVYAEPPTSAGESGSGRVAIQDPGR